MSRRRYYQSCPCKATRRLRFSLEGPGRAYTLSSSCLVPTLPLASLLWNGLAFALDVCVGFKYGAKKIAFQPQHFAGIAFGLASMVGCKPATLNSRLFTYAILLCFLVAVPSHDFEKGSYEHVVFDAFQTTALHWCIGLIIAAVALSRCAERHSFANQYYM